MNSYLLLLKKSTDVVITYHGIKVQLLSALNIYQKIVNQLLSKITLRILRRKIRGGRWIIWSKRNGLRNRKTKELGNCRFDSQFVTFLVSASACLGTWTRAGGISHLDFVQTQQCFTSEIQCVLLFSMFKTANEHICVITY